jgi:predicted acyltransferase
VASAIAGILSIWLRTRGLIVATAVLLIGYYLMLALIPVPGAGAGNFAEGKNLTNYLDSIWLPGRKHDGDHDPEGILSTLPAIATALLGLLAGKWLRTERAPITKAQGLVVAGAILFALGWAWHPFFPVVKKLWSSSFVLVAGGYSAMILALFYYIVDIRQLRGWCPIFVWVGANPLTLYLLHGLRFFSIVNERLVGSPKGNWAWIGSVTVFALMILTARWMYRRGIFLRV